MPPKDWVLVILIASAILVLVSRSIFPKKMSSLHSFATFIENQHNETLFGLYYYLLFSSLLSVSLAYLVDFPKVLLNNDFWNDVLFGMIIFSAFRIMAISVRILFLYLFSDQHKIQEYLQWRNFFYAWFSIIFLAVNMLIYYSDLPAYICLIIIIASLGTFFMIELLNQIISKKENTQTKWYHNFLYLCAIEFLPVLVLIHALGIL